MRYGVLLLLSGIAGGAATTYWVVSSRHATERMIEMIAQESGQQ